MSAAGTRVTAQARKNVDIRIPIRRFKTDKPQNPRPVQKYFLKLLKLESAQRLPKHLITHT